MDNDQNPGNDAPAGLIHAFRQLRHKNITVPRSLDDAVLKAARRTLTQPARVPATNRWWAIQSWPNWARIPGLAAVILLVPSLAFLLVPSRFAPEDINHDRLVNILDAFQLARELRSGTQLPASFDFNGDGIVNGTDVDLIAAMAVRVERSSRL